MSEYPTGAVANVELQKSHDAFVRAVEPSYVIMKITHARRLLKRGTDFTEHYPDSVNVITTTTVTDNQLNLIGWERDDDHLTENTYSELDIIKETKPDYHIPSDYSVYDDMTLEEQQEAVAYCIEGTKWFYERIEEEGLDVDLIPLMKGRNRNQREAFYEMYDDLGVDYVSYYATQYFTGGAGANIKDLRSDVDKLATEYDCDIFLLGLLGAKTLATMNTSVVAGSGLNQWRKACTPRTSSDSEMISEWENIQEKTTEALNTDPFEEDS